MALLLQWCNANAFGDVHVCHRLRVTNLITVAQLLVYAGKDYASSSIISVPLAEQQASQHLLVTGLKHNSWHQWHCSLETAVNVSMHLAV